MNIRKAASIVLVVGMFLTAYLINNNEIIFPEISALAVGSWVMLRSPWQSRKLYLWLSPTLAAFTGMALLKLLPYYPFLLIAAALILVIIQLELLHSDVYPAISAAILPVIVHAGSWLYPVSVCILTGIILGGRAVLGASAAEECLQPPGAPVQPRRIPAPRYGYWIKICLFVLLSAAAAVGFGTLYILAPPLIVVFVELTQPKGALREKHFRVLLLIALAAFSGVFWLLFFEFLQLPVWFSVLFSMGWLFLLYQWTGISLPPAAAITLLPTIVPPEKLLLYPLQVSLGCSIYIIVAALAFKDQDQAAGGG